MSYFRNVEKISLDYGHDYYNTVPPHNKNVCAENEIKTSMHGPMSKNGYEAFVTGLLSTFSDVILI